MPGSKMFESLGLLNQACFGTSCSVCLVLQQCRDNIRMNARTKGLQPHCKKMISVTSLLLMLWLISVNALMTAYVTEVIQEDISSNIRTLFR